MNALKMALTVPDLDLIPDPNPGPNPGLGLTEAHVGMTHVPAPTGATPGAGLAAQMAIGVKAIAAPPCRLVVDTLETESTQIPTTVWVCLV